MARRRLLLIGLAILALALVAIQASRIAARYYLGEGVQRAETTLRLTVNGLSGHLLRYEALPRLLAEDEEVRALLLDPGPERTREMNLWFRDTNAVLQSSDIYVMDREGLTVAASNFDRADSFIGQNFSYRPYFTGAVAGENARFYALGTTSGVRGYYFSAPIRDDAGAVAGVIVIKIGLDAIEASWRGGGYRIFVMDPEGIVFMSTEPGWLYAALLPLTPERLARTAVSRRYSDAELRPLDHSERQEQGMRVMSVAGADGQRHDYLTVAQSMPEAGWTVHVQLDTASLLAQARLAVLAGVLLCCVAGSGAVLVAQRRARLAERLAMQQQARAELERRVEERTADLARVNERLGREIAERRQTEKELRRTQADLVQAGKLAALGQMSAALSHEINQPLAAARNYADSAAILIERGEHGRAQENVGQILSLIDRMAAIGKHLRNVARKPNQPLSDVDLAAAVADARQIAATRLAAAGAALEIDLPPGLRVRAGAVRLQQVLVNILSNAADAVEGRELRRIRLHAEAQGAKVAIRIRDSGPGVPAAIAERIFDPFFTTKRVGAGLGLGLSISYNIVKDFGGDLRVETHPEGGAVFTVLLDAAGSLTEAQGVAAQ